VSAGGKPAGRWRRAFFIALGVAVISGLLWWVITELTKPVEGKKKRAVQEISLLKPPPPPPPPKDQPPPPPKVEQQKIDVPKPQDQPPDKQADSPPPPGPDLAVDAAGGAGGDSFGLVGKPGGTALIGSGTGGAGSRFAWYGALIKERIQERIQEAMAKDKRLQKADYRITVHVWVSPTGAVTRAELIDSTNDADMDSAIKVALRSLPALREGAPSDMPQPIKLRITAR